jgi:hypothetical protein
MIEVNYSEYFKKLHEQVVEKGIFQSTKQVFNNRHWLGFSYGSVFGFICVFVKAKKKIAVELYIDAGKLRGTYTKAIFDELLQDKENLENQFGYKLNFERLDSKRASRISVEKDVADDNDFNSYIQWHLNTLRRFKEIFSKEYLEKLIRKVPYIEDDNTSIFREHFSEEDEGAELNLQETIKNFVSIR